MVVPPGHRLIPTTVFHSPCILLPLIVLHYSHYSRPISSHRKKPAAYSRGSLFEIQHQFIQAPPNPPVHHSHTCPPSSSTIITTYTPPGVRLSSHRLWPRSQSFDEAIIRRLWPVYVYVQNLLMHTRSHLALCQSEKRKEQNNTSLWNKEVQERQKVTLVLHTELFSSGSVTLWLNLFYRT